MRQLHYILAAVRFTFTALILYFMYKSGGANEPLFGILILCDVLTLSFEAIRIKQLRETHEIVSIQHPKNFLKRLSPYVWMVVAAASIFLSLQSQTFDMMTVVPIYVVGSHFLFKRNRADFYLDTRGMVQPELFKKNYDWTDISDFEIYDDAISFYLKAKEVVINIPDGKAEEIHEFMIKNRLEQFVTIP